jgi:uncharacterized protein involved in propanediol utilization
MNFSLTLYPTKKIDNRLLEISKISQYSGELLQGNLKDAYKAVSLPLMNFLALIHATSHHPISCLKLVQQRTWQGI